jgi:hypothetical protein
MRLPFPALFALRRPGSIAAALLGLAAVAGPARGADEPAAPPPAAGRTNPVVRTLEGGLLEIGTVRLDPERRTVTFPAFVNLREGMIEYVVVHSGGKTHESLLRTDARPRDIHLAMLLVGARGAGTNALPLDPDLSLPGDMVTVEVRWTSGRRVRVAAAEELVYDRRLGSALRRGRWTYTGSRLREDGFGAQADGSIVALITDPDALVNNPRRGREDDDNWLAKATRLPEFNHPVEVVLTLLPPPAPRR